MMNKKNKTVIIQVRMSVELKEKLDAEAERRTLSASAFARMLIKQGLDRETEKDSTTT